MSGTIDAEEQRALTTATRALEHFTSLREALLALPEWARLAALEDQIEDAEVRAEVARLGALHGLLPPSQEADELEPGGLVAGRCRVVKKVGEGGVGVVYLATQETPVSRQVAIKVLPDELAGPSAGRRFDAERDALARMNHP